MMSPGGDVGGGGDETTGAAEYDKVFNDGFLGRIKCMRWGALKNVGR
jgi:hypothetical protein